MSKRANDASSVQDAAPMEQVRELLFGQQLKDMEIRFRRQEERLMRELSDARDSLKKRIDSLENFMKSETATILHRLKEETTERTETLKTEQRERGEAIKNEQRERAEAFKNEQRERSEALKNEQRERVEGMAQMGRDLASASEALERKIAKLSSTLDTTERELRQLLLTESGSLTDKIEEKYQDALNVISKTASQIRDDMVYRTSLSGMFTECALKLSGQWAAEMDHMPHFTSESMDEAAYEAAEAHDSGTE